MNEPVNILFSGLGGQGIMLASEICAYSLIAAGYNVKKSEVHGMAQRGGPVVAHLRFGHKINSPVIDLGCVDIQVCFEKLEVLRHIQYLKPSCQVILNSLQIPAPVQANGTQPQVQDVASLLRDLEFQVLEIDALKISRATGYPQTMNMAMVGALSTLLPVPEALYEKVITSKIPAGFLAANLAAFANGRAMAASFRRLPVGS